MKRHWRLAVGLAAVAALAVAIGVVFPGSMPSPAQVASREPRNQRPSVAAISAPTRGPLVLAGKKIAPPAPSSPSLSTGVFARASWGARPDQLGRLQPQEGNPEAPMSLALEPGGSAVALDQVNGRLVRFGKDGKALGTVELTVQGAQDLALAADGTAVVLDRLVDKTVALIDPSGKLRGELPLEGKGIPEGGAVTGVFVDGQDVYVEREHADLVRIGDLSGKADPDRPEIPGRPSRDGLSFLTAGLIDGAAGRLYVSSIVRQTRQHRFTRELRLAVPLYGIVLLDTDRAGVIYLAAVAEAPSGNTQPAAPPVVLLTCLDPLDGRPLGKAELPANTSADETFRELTVFDEGGVLYAWRDEEGVRFLRADCR